MNKENLESNLYICYRDNGFECTNFQHARGYLFLYSREEEADQEGFCNATEEDLLAVIKEMGFERCEDGTKEDCIKWKLVDKPVCFKRKCGYRRKKGKRNALA